MRRIVVTVNESGGGHIATAEAIREIVARQKRPWTIEFLDLDAAIESLDVVHRVAGIHFSDVHNFLLRRNLTFGWRWLMAFGHWGVRRLHTPLVRILRNHWKGAKPDLVLAVTPHLNRALYESLQLEWPGTRYVTLPTDLADYAPGFWFEPQDQYAICGTAKLHKQALATLSDPRKIERTSGMALNPRFYDLIEADRGAERERLGLRADLPTGIVLFGGFASKRVEYVLAEVAAAQLNVQFIVLCGSNRDVARRLRERTYPFPLHVQDFTNEVHRFMWLSDFFIGKPGPGSMSEAMTMGLPLIIHRDFRTLYHERHNADWAEQQGVGIVAGMHDIPKAIQDLLQPRRYESMRRRIAGMPNRAIFEIPDILERILAQSPESSVPADDLRRAASR